MPDQDSFAELRATVCGVEELHGHAGAGATHVLSILDPQAPTPPAFGAFGEHARLDLRFHDIVKEVPGQRAPERADVEALLGFGRSFAMQPQAHLLVHCEKGMSRSTAALTLILAQARPERPEAAVLAEVVRIRPKAWPNLRLIEIGDALLGRGGKIIAAAAAHYRAVLARRPELAQAVIAMDRGRELDCAWGAGGNGSD